MAMEQPRRWLESVGPAPENINVDALLRQCLAESVAFVPGRICDPLDQMDSWIRLSYSYISEVQLEEGIRRLVEISEQVKHGSLA